MNEKVKIVLLGDSITQGIGSRQINYEKKLKSYLNANGIESSIFNLALTGTTIDHAFEQISKIRKINPNYVIIMYGSVDLQVRPNMNTNKWGILSITPKRYKNIKGMLNPRPFMSSRKSRYILDCADNLYRKIWKRVVIATQGTMQYLSEEEFEQKYMSFLHEVKDYKVICASTMWVDEKIYTKKTIENYEAANCFLSNLETKSSNIAGFADLYNMQKNIIDKVDYNEIFCNDRFHPNENGYEKISQVLGKIIISNMC